MRDHCPETSITPNSTIITGEVPSQTRGGYTQSPNLRLLIVFLCGMDKLKSESSSERIFEYKMTEPRKKSKKPNARASSSSNRVSDPPEGARSVWSLDREKFLLMSGSLLILALTFLAYVPALSAGFVWDDPQHFGLGRMQPTWEGLKDLWIGHRFYYPLTSTTFWVIRRIWDMEPLPYHLVNIVLHGINSILLWRIVSRLRMPFPFLCGLLFALHPVHVQSVAWATELKNTQSGLFYLVSLRFFMIAQDRPDHRHYIGSLVAFLAALLSKTSTVTLPFILLLLHLWRGGVLDRKSILRLAPYFGLSMAMGGMTVFFHQDQVTNMDYWDESLFERVLLAARGVWFYIQKFMWPATLVFVYPRWNLSEGLVLWLLHAISLTLMTAWLWHRSKDSSWRRAALFGFVGFVASLLPVLNFFKMFYTRYAYTADHWQYLADMVAVPLLIGFVATCLSSLLRVFGPDHLLHSLKGMGYAFLFMVFATLCVKTSIQCRDYDDIESLWRQSLRKSPNSYLARANLAVHLTDSGRLDEAFAQYEAALPLDEDMRVTYVGMGRIEYLRERYDEAEVLYRKVLEIYPEDADALNGIAGICVKQEKYGEAMELLDRAIQAVPTHAESHTNRGRLFDAIGKKDEAIAAYTRAIDLNPSDSKARQHLADDLRAVGRYEEAMTQYSFSIQLDPTNTDAALALGGLMGGAGNFERALEIFMSALDVSPDNAGLHFNIGVTLRKLGREAESQFYLGKAAQLDPQFAQSQD